MSGAPVWAPVDPRVGGGDIQDAKTWPSGHGRSPRGRGRRYVGKVKGGPVGSIPAWAGETTTTAEELMSSTVDPRVGGGDRRALVLTLCSGGRSPRGRGRLQAGTRALKECRSIPAWAGETAAPRQARGWQGVDPRVGGGDNFADPPAHDAAGRSPRGRGRPSDRPPEEWELWSIPAWAGETRGSCSARPRSRVDPRVGGGDPPCPSRASPTYGRSPRGRGRRRGARPRADAARSIPAWAGETRHDAALRRLRRVDPRVGGGDPCRSGALSPAHGRSPRGRGRPRLVSPGYRDQRSIPAGAGETAANPRPKPHGPVDPRVGGGDCVGTHAIAIFGGRSPRGRGRRPA